MQIVIHELFKACQILVYRKYSKLENYRYLWCILVAEQNNFYIFEKSPMFQFLTLCQKNNTLRSKSVAIWIKVAVQ